MLIQHTRLIALLAFLGCLQNLFAASTAVIIAKDLMPAGSMTITLRDFNGDTPTTFSPSNNAGQPLPTHVSTENGYATFNVAGKNTSETNSHDPRITFTTVPYDVTAYNYVRANISYSIPETNTTTGTPSNEMWPNNAASATTVPMGNLSTNFVERSFAWVNPTHANIVTATSGGFRWDPVVPNAIAFGDSVNFHLDYFMVDRGRVVGFEFDRVGLGNPGWSHYHIDTANQQTLLDSANQSVLRGTTTGGDPYMYRNDLALDSNVFKYVEVRLKTSNTTNLQFFWATDQAGNTGFSESKSAVVSTGDNQWHTYLLDFTHEPTWTGNIKQFRIDLGSTIGLTYDIDYIRFRELGIIPEPSKALLLSTGVTLALLRRRRS